MMIGFEGEVLHPYPDERGIPTIGIGTTMYENGNHVTLRDPVITSDRAIELLQFTSLANQRLLNYYFTDGVLTQGMNDGMLSLLYRIGPGHFQTSTVLRLARINPSDPAIENAWLLWDKLTIDGTLVFSQGEYNRCQKEYQVYIS